MKLDRSERDLIIRYLLGELPEVEESRIEETYFNNDEYFDLVEAVETDLIDRYLRSELEAPERQRFEKHYISSPRRRERIETERALLIAIDATQDEKVDADEPKAMRWLDSVAIAFRSLNPVARFSIAAIALAAILVTGWLAIRDGSTVSFSLSTTLRDSGQIERFVIPPDTDWIRFEIDIEMEDEFGSFRATLATSSGRVLWSKVGIEAETVEGEQTLYLTLPAELLQQGQHEAVIAGLRDTEYTDIGYYDFIIVR